MNVLALCLALAQAPSPSGAQTSAQGASSSPTDAAASAAPAAPAIEVPQFAGLADGLTKLQLATSEGKADVAVALADALLAPDAWSRARTELEGEHAWLRKAFDTVEPAVAFFGFGGPSSAARAEVHYAAGVALERGGDRPSATQRFRTAHALAGPGSLRLDAGYDVGAVALALAEDARAASRRAPTAAQAQGSGLPGPGSAGPQSVVPQGGDPLDALEGGYRAAKHELVERLRADWKDEDTRANLELVQRRLREIQQQREERKRQQEQQDQQKQDSKKDRQNEDQQQKQDSKDDSQKQDESKQDSKSGDPQQDRQQQSNEERKDQPKPEDGEQKQDQDAESQDAKPSEQDPSKQVQDPKDAQDTRAPTEERVLTREEVQRILGQLEQIEKEGKTLQARLRRARQRGAEKDW
jgi:Ca-activated chloride channel family protein